MNRTDKRSYLSQLFREAYEHLSHREIEEAKRKFDRIMELSKDEFPDIYFEACFMVGEIFFEENNYKGCVKCALRAIKNAPTNELYEMGISRLKDIIYVLNQQGSLNLLGEDMDTTLALLEDDEELYAFAKALVELARGNVDSAEEWNSRIKTKSLRDILERLTESS